MNLPSALLEASPADEIAALLKAAADPLRLEILRVLARDSFGVLELCELFEVKQSGMSHHLKVLARAELVSTRREGNSIFYRRSLAALPKRLDQLRLALFQTADQLELNDKLRARIEQIYAQRSAASRDFFAARASHFKQQQDLIAAYEVYGPQVAEFVAKRFAHGALALELGPGSGEFLPALAKVFERVIAIDSSQEMLNEARLTCRRHQVNNIEFIHADSADCRQFSAQIDCAVVNMVLHHTPSPATVFADLAGTLKAGGALLICDLCDHDQDWVRKACGDLWLGFDTADLLAWAAENQLQSENSTYIALRNGFQIQIHQFIKQ